MQQAPDGRLFAAVDILTLKDLARAWGHELKLDWKHLAASITQDAANGVFDHLPPTKRFLFRDASGTTFDWPGSQIRTRMAEWDDHAQTAMLDDHALAIHKDAVAVFAERHRLAGPSWWASPAPPRRKGGRPQDHDWEGCRKAIEEAYTDRALPDIQQRLVEHAREWFEKHDGGKAPDDSQIRKQLVKPLYDAS